MLLAYIGNFDTPLTSESIWARAFDRLGHAVIKIRHDEAGADGDGTFQRLIADKPDVVFYSRTHNHTALSEPWTQRWRALEAAGTKTCALHLDLFFGLEAEREALVTGGDPLFTMGLVCTPDGGHDEQFAAAGVNHRWLPPAIDKEMVYLGEPQREYIADVVFVGSGGYHPAYPERPALIEAAKTRWGDGFLHVGPDGIGSLRGHDLNPVIASAKVVLGDSCFALNPERRVRSYWSDRVTETLGRGGLLVHPFVPGLGEYHKVMQSGPNGISDLLYQADQLLSAYSPVERASMRKAVQASVLANHTYDHRAAQVIDWLKEE